MLHLQPILELATGKIKHGELLLRMKGERGKLIAPGAFLPAAERFGLIHAIDRWVVARAIQLVGQSMGAMPRVGINLSGESVVGDPELLRMIERELERSSVDPSKLIFEVTETAAIANMPEATAVRARPDRASAAASRSTTSAPGSGPSTTSSTCR